nr:ATP-dependent DNA helicase RecG [Maliibacterium massiliense]
MDTPVTACKGVGPKRAALLAQMGIVTVRDALFYLPRAYEDRSNVKEIAALAPGEEALVTAMIAGPVRLQRIPGRHLAMTRAMLEDDSGKIEAVWFNQPYLKNTLREGQTYRFFGRVDVRRGRALQNPSFEPAFDERRAPARALLPVYRVCAGVTQKMMRDLVAQALQMRHTLPDPFDNDFRRAHHLAERKFALEAIHFPEDAAQRSEAQRRFAFEELFYYQMMLQMQRRARQGQHRAMPLALPEADRKAFLSALPYALTGAQARTIAEILQDIARDTPMNRMVQGDVGSGKTVVAAMALLAAVKSGAQGVLMAPTEVLAQQHHRTLSALLEPLGVRVGLRTGAMRDAQKRRADDYIQTGVWQVVVGTHALIQQDVRYKNLGVVVTDEQHRFGVRQRAVLSAKGEAPHTLVMSATPIPRTLSLVLYGDLDVSLIDELPPGRKPVRTRVVPAKKRGGMYDFVHAQVREGHQCYVVCPLVEASENVAAKSAEDVYDELRKGPLRDVRVGLLHGQMKAGQKEAVLSSFAQGALDVLVSTTVIEVGVDVPRASVMVIEDAARFGLAQLHQLRGRVGRGAAQAWCFLVCDQGVDNPRLEIMTRTQNGFDIAQRDLELRGPGELLGMRQSGVLDTTMALLARDMALVKETQEAALQIVSESGPRARALKQEAMDRLEARTRQISMT